MLTARSRTNEALGLHHRNIAARASPSWVDPLAWFFLALGAAVRILAYLGNPSLSIDESYLALNLIQKSPADLVRTLDFNQAAPIGFLEAEKLVITILGRSEYALRLLPLIASLVALFAFYLIARNLLRPLGAIVAVAAFALLDPLIYYSTTAKQYALDVFAAVIILAVGLVLEHRPVRNIDLLGLSVLGALLVWFSHASVFALASLAALLAVCCISDRDWKRMPLLVATVGIWTASFLFEFLLTRTNLAGIISSIEPESGTLLTPAEGSASWLDRTADHVRYLVGLEDTATGDPVLASLPTGINRGLTMLILLVAGVGLVSLFRRRPRFALLMATAPALALIASAAHQYPLTGRTLLFVLPSIALCMGEGAQSLVAIGKRRKLAAIPAAAVTSSVAAIAILPLVHVFDPRTGQEMRQALKYLGAHHRPNDTLYVSAGAQYALAYYHLCGCSDFDPRTAWSFSTTTGGRNQRAAAVESRSPRLIIEGSSSDNAAAVTKSLIGRSRVWILLADAPGYRREPLIDSLDGHGQRLQRFQGAGPASIAASLYLYDLAIKSPG